MRKKKVIKPHEIKPDPKFASIIVSRLTNKIMKNGNKRKAREIVYKAAEIVEKWFKEQQAKQKKEGESVEKVPEPEREEKKISSEAKQVGPSNQVVETGQESFSSPFLTVLERALANVKPAIEMKGRRVGASRQRIPKEIDDTRSLKTALRWLVEGAKERRVKGKKLPHPMFEMFENLAEEIKDAYNNSGEAFKKKVNLYKEAESGRVFSR